MNRRLLLIGICVFAAVFVGVVLVQRPQPAEAITVRFHGFATNGTQLLAVGVISNATLKEFVLSLSTEYMTNGVFPNMSHGMFPMRGPFVTCLGEGHGLMDTDLAPGSNRCRLLVQYQRTPATRFEGMLEPLRTKLLGQRPIHHGYSEEFHSPP